MTHPIILFDAECVLCSVNAQFILEHDKVGYFHLASMQGATGAALYSQHGIDPKDPSTLIVVDGERVRFNSDAVLHIYEQLGYPWRLIGVARVVPVAIRDAIYLYVAKNRYRWFGKRSTCWIAPGKFKDRIL